MGAGQSTAALPSVSLSHTDVHLDNDFSSSPSVEALDWEGQKTLVIAYQSSPDSRNGNWKQHIRVAVSIDGGLSWSHSTAVQWGICPLWAPVLFWDRESQRLLMFYCESRKVASPGGDVKMMSSRDCGRTWSPPTTILCHETDGEVPKLTSNRPVVDDDGTWYLPVHHEPYNSHRIFTHPDPAPPSDRCTPRYVPEHSAAQSVITAAAVLISCDRGVTWHQSGVVEDARHWVIQPALAVLAPRSLLALFRTSSGWVYEGRSQDGGRTWTKPTATALPNPNSKVAMLRWDAQSSAGAARSILLVHNASAKQCSPLVLSISMDDGRSWQQLAEIDAAGSVSSPSVVEFAPGVLKVAYVQEASTLRLATLHITPKTA